MWVRVMLIFSHGATLDEHPGNFQGMDWGCYLGREWGLAQDSKHLQQAWQR
jgi:hypothetical protein